MNIKFPNLRLWFQHEQSPAGNRNLLFGPSDGDPS